MNDSDEDVRELRRDFEALVPPPNDLAVVVGRIRRRRLRRYLVGAVSVVVIATALILPLRALLPLTDDARPRGLADADPSVTVLGTEEIRMPDGIMDIALGYGSVWVPGAGTLTRLDPTTGDTVASIRVPGSSDYRSVAIGEGAVWVTDSGQEALFRVDPGSNELVATVRIEGPVLRVATGGGYVWVTVPTDGRGLLVRVDPATNGVSGDPIQVGVGPGNISYLGGYLWVENSDGMGSVMRIEPATGTVSTRVSHLFPRSQGSGSFWSAENGSVVRMDEATNQVEATIDVVRASDVAFGEGGAWALSATGSTSQTIYEPDPTRPATVQRIDPADNSLVGTTIPVGMTPGYLAVGLGSVWFGDFTNSTLTRVEVSVT